MKRASIAFGVCFLALSCCMVSAQQNASIPAIETARAEKRILFENTKVVLFFGRLTKSLINQYTDRGSLYVKFKDSGQVKSIPSSQFGFGTRFRTAVATKDGRVAYVVARSRPNATATQSDIGLFWVNLSTVKTKLLVSATRDHTRDLGAVVLAPDERSLAFLGSKVIPISPCKPDSECFMNVSVGYHLILGDYANPKEANPKGAGKQLKTFEFDPKLGEGIPCFDNKGVPKTCSPIK